MAEFRITLTIDVEAASEADTEDFAMIIQRRIYGDFTPVTVVSTDFSVDA